MSMVSELVKELRKYAKGFKNSSYGREIVGTERLLTQAADTIEELSAKVARQNMERSRQYYGGGWILCEDRMPEKCGNYLIVTNKGNVYVAKFYTNGFSGVGRYATYWRSLPLPPAYEPKGD